MSDDNPDQCTATAGKTGERCRNPTRFGSPYCIVHLDVGEYFNSDSHADSVDSGLTVTQ